MMTNEIFSSKIDKSQKDIKKIKELYKKSFPKIERIPFSFMLLFSKKKEVKFNAYYIENNFCGFCYYIMHKGMIFISYLAVSENMRSKGVGSKILGYIKQEEKKSIVITLESLDIIDCDNRQEREKRFSFYIKNGYVLQNIKVRERGELMDVMSNGDFNLVEFFDFIEQYAKGYIEIEK